MHLTCCRISVPRVNDSCTLKKCCFVLCLWRDCLSCRRIAVYFTLTRAFVDRLCRSACMQSRIHVQPEALNTLMQHSRASHLKCIHISWWWVWFAARVVHVIFILFLTLNLFELFSSVRKSCHASWERACALIWQVTRNSWCPDYILYYHQL